MMKNMCTYREYNDKKDLYSCIESDAAVQVFLYLLLFGMLFCLLVLNLYTRPETALPPVCPSSIAKGSPSHSLMPAPAVLYPSDYIVG